MEMHGHAWFTAGDGVQDVADHPENVRIFHRHLKKMSYICSMESTFTYYEHLNALDKVLVSHKFIDGETYVITELTSYYKNYIIRGNFYVNMTVLENGRWIYRDVIKEQGIRIDGNNFRKIMSITKPLNFKKISK